MNTVLTHPTVSKLVGTSKEKKSLSFFYRSTLLDAFNDLISEAVALNKNIVVSSSHAKDLKELFDYIRSQYLLAMHIDSEFVNTETINKWRLALKKKSNVQNRLIWNGIRRNIKRLESDIASYYTQTSQKNITNLTTNSNQREYELYMPILEYCLPSHLFNGTEVEFHDLTKTINKFSLSYKPEYKLLSQIDHFEEFMLNVDDSANIPLDKLVLRANELSVLFLNNINTYKAKWQTQLKSQEKLAIYHLRSLNIINEKLSALNLELSKSSSFIERLTSNFQTKTQQENFKYSIELEFDEWLDTFSKEFPKIYAEYTLTEDSTIEPNILILKQLLQSYINEIKKQKQFEGQQQFNQLNAQNCPIIFKEILDELKRFYTELSNHHLLDSLGVDKSFNLHSSYQYLSSVKSMLDSLLLMNEIHPTYVVWKKEFNSLNRLEKLIINTFIDQIADYQNWKSIFQEYYAKILRAIAIPDTSINDLISKYKSLKQQESSLMKESLNNIQKFDIRENIERLKQTNPKLFKELFQKKYRENTISIYTLINEMHELLPLCFVRKEILSQSTNPNWDLHIHIDFYGKEDTPSDITFSGKEVVHLRCTSESPAIDFDSKAYLKHPKVQTDEDQLNFCRALMQKLSVYQDRIQIFNCGQMFIVSFLDKLLNIQMLETNEHLTFKEFIIDNDLNYSLDDILFNGSSKIHILTQDGLLNPYDSLSLDWQLYVIDLMLRAGMQVQTVSLAELMDGNNSSILLKKTKEYHNVVEVSAPEQILTTSIAE